MVRFAFLLLATIVFLAASATAQAADEKPLLAGAATSNITPWLGTNKVEEQASVKIVDALLEMFTELKD